MEENKIIDFTLIYNRFKKPLYNYLAKIVRSEMLAEDIAHNVFLKLFNNLSSIRQKDRIEIWIFTTARNEAYGHFRKLKTRKEEELNEESLSTANFCYDEYERTELIQIIEGELGKMDEAQSEVYYLKEYSGLSYKEVAAVMNITEDLVRSRLFKVRQKLKTAITNLV
jgi:RNA polymerase sigma-70 factor (ECF subfamily)